MRQRTPIPGPHALACASVFEKGPCDCVARDRHEYGDLLGARLAAAGLSDEQRMVIRVILDGLCQHCWDNEPPCSCMRDD